MNNLHGGAAALIFDLCTSVALAPIASGSVNADPSPSSSTSNGTARTDSQQAEAARTTPAAPFWLFPGVSRTLDVVYHRPAHAGWECRVVCTVVSVGRRLAHIRGEIRRWLPEEGRMGEVLCTCEHGKVGIVAQKL